MLFVKIEQHLSDLLADLLSLFTTFETITYPHLCMLQSSPIHVSEQIPPPKLRYQYFSCNFGFHRSGSDGSIYFSAQETV
jgi:hypothetical protein